MSLEMPAVEPGQLIQFECGLVRHHQLRDQDSFNRVGGRYVHNASSNS